MAPPRRSWLGRLFGGGVPEAEASPAEAPAKAAVGGEAVREAVPPGAPVLDILFGPRAEPDAAAIEDLPEPSAPSPAFAPAAVAPSGPEETGDEAPPPPAYIRMAPPPVSLRTALHVSGTGDVETTGDGWAGTPGASIEGLSLIVVDGIDPEDIECRVVLDDGSMTDWVPGDRYSGTRGEARPLRGFAVRLAGPAVMTHVVRYRGAFAGGAQVGPCDAGAICATPDGAVLEAVQVLVTPMAPHGS
ncbi:hypothetical protein [Acidisphaera rubrifaciens]|uniref:Uncharacterized protein n=1 Tax=Acidisphaera rubrifaciens HS-AP3 TaxID=1231350 RepID=A0A0D6P9L0_9PROT|nr:hypothetical protein [Acidisphaera rubrifaciens]GAN78342.1 hypothetical protein Asru_0773_01 [Acidisphaera rubrifaciens HS-AP3]